MIDPNTDIGRTRLLTGDTATEELDQYLPDNIYDWFLQDNEGDVYEAAIAALETIINQLSLTPERWRIGDASENRANIDTLEKRLDALILKRNRVKKTPVPILLNTDRKDWSDFEAIFGE
ncbi:hypothetical protein KZO83_04490 [Chromohalobacter sp. TMW 2.2308]|uniref:hypothetical protein n=1 Tax=Chromohalobacter TaxID=42054 RepID=UPI001FFD2C22|nr:MULTISPECIES: hypothetical protein [Chromohalobacter]MCK2041945.1 hypothetical protein [Chromohalobacter moromii]MCT8514093.1 hypothetical protein [Chromohalobacter sp. TMW 2.2271]